MKLIILLIKGLAYLSHKYDFFFLSHKYPHVVKISCVNKER
ncbi:hypothetical protein Patl1_12219 [Pistacia atlantica]|uniref:Uncharacterized protein n=1 Tax=Pistacia atlantica TaxID=434234 RepID=A0ACC1A616_9ROSI|nr:hypothetical protein Patl1_12219 [Pistacia atlantica]